MDSIPQGCPLNNHLFFVVANVAKFLQPLLSVLARKELIHFLQAAAYGGQNPARPQKCCQPLLAPGGRLSSWARD